MDTQAEKVRVPFFSLASQIAHFHVERAYLMKAFYAYPSSLADVTQVIHGAKDVLSGGTDTDLVYHFIGEGQEFDQGRLEKLLGGAGVPADKTAKVIEFMLYYGFLGVKTGHENPRYIFDVGYDMKLLSVLAAKAKDALIYVLNAAFHPGLNL